MAHPEGGASAKGFPQPARSTRPVSVGEVCIGGGAPVSLQTMTKTDTGDIAATLQQIRQVAAAGADLVRVAIPRAEVLESFAIIARESPLPVIADIHFDHRLAIAAAERGAAKLRVNPGNLGGAKRWHEVLLAATEVGIPVRVGVNAGSLPANLLARHGGPTAAALAEAALDMVTQANDWGFSDMVVSLKASDISQTIIANRLFAAASAVPLHIGLTEAGLGQEAIIRSAVATGVLLGEGIGETIRISLTGEPRDEILAAQQILRAVGLRRGPLLVSCPTCGRCQVDLVPLARDVRALLDQVDQPLVVAVMGCEVNGPGEAKHADIGLAAGKDSVALFREGQVLRRVPMAQAAAVLLEEIRRLLEDRS